jgi:ribosomal protein S12 methylthiotransferase
VLSSDGGSTGTGLEEVLQAAARPYFLYDDTMPRQLATKSHMAYVKVGEGCNRPCTFCIIPKIRGTMRSRTIESVVREVTALSQMGVREVNLVAQDLTSYGLDLKKEDGSGSRQLTELLRALDASGAVDWVRLLYAYPIGIDEALLDAIRDLPRVVEYLDLPLQHASEAVLARMKRPLGRYSPRKIVELITSRAPELALRTTFIVGFPGETDADVKELEDFIREGHFASVGIFTYSAEAGTPAHDLEGQVSEKVKKSRLARLMKAQQEVLKDRLSRYIGKSIQVLVEGAHDETDLLVVGRARFQAPEVDGIVIINDAEGLSDGQSLQALLQPGSMVTVEVTEIAGYDLIGRVVK